GGGQAGGSLLLAGGGAGDDPQGEQGAEHGGQAGQDLRAGRGREAAALLGGQGEEHQVGGGVDGLGGDAAGQDRGQEGQPPPAEQLDDRALAPGVGPVEGEVGVAGPPDVVQDLLGAEEAEHREQPGPYRPPGAVAQAPRAEGGQVAVGAPDPGQPVPGRDQEPGRLDESDPQVEVAAGGAVAGQVPGHPG